MACNGLMWTRSAMRMLVPIVVLVGTLLPFHLGVVGTQAAVFKIGINLPYLTPSFGVTIQNIANYIRANQAAVLNGIDPNGQHTIELVYTPTNHTQLATTIATINSVQNDNIVAAVGDFASSMSIPAALAGGKYFLYMCSGASTSGQLSDKSLYPYFFRTIADDPSQGIVIAYYLKHMGWRSAALVSSNDAYGQSVSGTFLSTAQSLGITVKANQVFNPGQTDYTFLLDAVLASGSHIIVLASSASTSIPFVKAASARGLIGPEWVWVAPEAYDTWNGLGSTKAHRDMANGMIYVYPEAKTFNTAFNASVARYNQAYPNSTLSNYGFMFLDCLSALAQGVIKLAQEVSPADILSRNYQPNMTKYFLHPFDGVTGRIEYDRTGNRIASFQVYNWYDGVSSLVYDVLPNKTVVQRAPVRFNDGTSNVPRDSTRQDALVPYWDSPSGIALVVLNVIILVAIATAWVALLLWREHSTVRSLSFPFLSLICLGCASVIFSNIAGLGTPTDLGCQASLWLFTYGFELVMASSAAKAYRLWRIFDNKYISAGRVGNKYLFSGVAGVMLVQTIILAVWTGIGAQSAVLVSRRTYYFFRCTSVDANINSALSGVTIAYNALLLLVLIYLAYKTRNVAMNYNETSFLFYTGQNTLLSGAVVAAFAFFDFGDSHLSGFLVKQIVIMYAVAFAFAALVGRIAIAAVLAPGGPSSTSKAPLNSNMSTAKTAMQTYSPNITATGKGPSATPSVAPSQASASDKNSNFVQEVLPCKKLGSLLSTWVNHSVVIFTNPGVVSLLPAKEDAEVGTTIRLSKLHYDCSETFENCIEIWAKGKGWALQFPNAELRDTWLNLLGTSNATKKTPTSSSTGAATSGQRKPTVSGA